jgi:hypothetical protein
MSDKEIKEEVKNIKVFGNGRLINPETGEYFVRFENGEALVSKDEAQTIKKYHKQVRFVGQKEKLFKSAGPNMINPTKPKSFNDIKVGFKIPDK